jgi:hypothetical protein
MGELDGFAYLWDGSQPGWCLVQIDAAQSPGTAAYAIYNPGDSHALIIEDDEIYMQVIERMLAEGCPIVPATELNDRGPGDT